MPYNHAAEYIKEKEESKKPKPVSPIKIAIISDIHSNIEALDAVLHDIKQRGIEKILCVGDIVGYATSCNECCAVLKRLKIPSVQGNHDLNINLKNLDWFNQDARAALKWTAGELTQANKSFLLNLPKVYEEIILGKKIYIVHGSLRDPIYEYVYPDVPDSTLLKVLEETKSDVMIFGHTHIPFLRKIGRGIVINAGSIGQPRDRDPRACYVILDIKNLEAKIIRLGYNIDGCAEKIKKAGLPEFLANRLYGGM